MIRRLIKELRALLPAILAVFIVPPLSILGAGEVEVATILCVVTCSILGAMVFGHEYHHRTMPLLLSQPLSRRRIWYEKMGVLAALLCAACLVTIFAAIAREDNSRDSQTVFWMILSATCAFLASPALTLLVKNTLAAAVFAPILPLGIGFVFWLACDILMPDVTGEANHDEIALYFYIVPGGVYAAVMYLVGCFRFARLESRESLAQDRELFWMNAPMAWISHRVWGGKTGLWSSLIKKELQLHKLNFMVILTFCAACLALMAYHIVRPNGDHSFFTVPFILYWLIAPITIGSITIAEERHLGLLEWHLTMPPARWKQLTVKTAVAAVLILVFLVALPLALIAWVFEPMNLNLFDGWRTSYGFHIIMGLGATTLAIYASSLTANATRAALAAMGMIIGTMAVPMLINVWGNSFLELLNPGELVSKLAFEFPGSMYVAVHGLLVGGITALFALALALTYANYSMSIAQRPFLWLQPCVVVVATGFYIFLLPALFRLLDTYKQI